MDTKVLEEEGVIFCKDCGENGFHLYMHPKFVKWAINNAYVSRTHRIYIEDRFSCFDDYDGYYECKFVILSISSEICKESVDIIDKLKFRPENPYGYYKYEHQLFLSNKDEFIQCFKTWGELYYKDNIFLDKLI